MSNSRTEASLQSTRQSVYTDMRSTVASVETIADCFQDDHTLDMTRFRQLLEQEEEHERARSEWFKELSEKGDCSDSEIASTSSGKTAKTGKSRKRSCQSLKPYYFNDDGQMVYLLPRQTFWYFVYVRSPPYTDQNFLKKFRRRFRIPFAEFGTMVNRLDQSGMFNRWRAKDACGKEASPMELLCLGALRYLGRGLTFDDLEEYTAINEETHRQFFHVFIEWGSTVLFNQWVKMPINATQFADCQVEFDKGGLNGAGFSTDATNVLLWRCYHSMRQSHIGFKNSHPARSYNLTCNHRRQILHTTTGHPARWNDKTLAWHDNFLIDLREGRILQDVVFELKKWSGVPGKSAVVTETFRGGWGLVDNGYHKWSCTQAPGKRDLLITERRLSQWIESFRKDSECTFGILKGRWRVLKTGIRLEGPEAADKIWLTCCALHNMLLQVDGLHKHWQQGVPSDWEGTLGDNNADDMRRHAPMAIRRLQNPEKFGSRQHELAAALPQPLSGRRSRRRTTTEDSEDSDSDDSVEEVSQTRRDTAGAIFVNSLSYADFRHRLNDQTTGMPNTR